MFEKDIMSKLKVRLRLREQSPGTITDKEFKLLYDFAKKLVKEFGGFIQGVIFFGSTSIGKKTPESDLDILVLVDDVSWDPTPELISTWRLGVGKILVDLKAQDKIHLTTLGITQYWDAVRHADPVILTILRDGQALVDTGFFKPMKKMLERGLFKATKEAIKMHFGKSQILLEGVKDHLIYGFNDIYWAVLDSVQAVLMSKKIYPVAPNEIVNVMKEKLVKKTKKITSSDISFVNSIIKKMKNIIKRKESIDFEELEGYLRKAKLFVNKMKNIANIK